MKAKLIVIASALLLISNVAGAQEPNAPTGEQEAPTAKMTGQDMMGAQEPNAPTGEQEAPTAKMTGQDMMGHMGGGMMGHGKMGHGMSMRIIFVLMDSDGDGALSLEEFQTAHGKIFKVIDADKDGKVTPAEMGMFMSGGSPTSNQ